MYCADDQRNVEIHNLKRIVCHGCCSRSAINKSNWTHNGQQKRDDEGHHQELKGENGDRCISVYPYIQSSNVFQTPRQLSPVQESSH